MPSLTQILEHTEAQRKEMMHEKVSCMAYELETFWSQEMYRCFPAGCLQLSTFACECSLQRVASVSYTTGLDPNQVRVVCC